MIIQKKVDYKIDPGEKIAGDRITESAGYIPPKTRIEEMIMAGQNLLDYRRERYDFPPDKEVDEKLVDEFYDPTRSPGFDAVDAQNLTRDALNRVKERSKDKKGENHGNRKEDASDAFEKDDAKDTSDKGKTKNGKAVEEN